MNKTTALVTALAAAVTLAQFAASAEANQEKCFGIAKAGKNQCQTKANACAGHALSNNEADAWILVPTGTCERIVNGSLWAGKGGSAGYNRKDQW
jgi:uncharacterized membrane protein